MLDDRQLQKAILDQLKWEPSVNASNITVTAKAGTVTLLGHVESFSERSAAERAVSRVKDVKAIVEEIAVHLPVFVKHDDEAVASAAANRLKWDSVVSSDAVTVKVEKGLVTLAGQVDLNYQRNAAAEAVRGLRGVVGVWNDITVKPKPYTSRLRYDIMVALDRSLFDPSSIHVNVVGGQVKLTGKVLSLLERSEAGRTAWAAPGTLSVENDLTVA